MSSDSKLTKCGEEIDSDDPNVKYYIYKKKFINRYGKEQESTIRVKYTKNTKHNVRDSITMDVIAEMKELNDHDTVQSALDEYIKILADRHPDVKPYSYNAFSKRWNACKKKA